MRQGWRRSSSQTARALGTAHRHRVGARSGGQAPAPIRPPRGPQRPQTGGTVGTRPRAPRQADWAEPVQKERHAQTVAPTVTLVSAPDHPWRRRQSRGPWSKPASAPSRILPPLRFRSPLCDFARLSCEVIRSRSPPFTLVSTENVWHFICGHNPQRPSPPGEARRRERAAEGRDRETLSPGRPERVKGTGKTEGR